MKRLLTTTLHAAALSIATFFVVGATWFVHDVVQDGKRAFFFTFESEPKEGWDYWYRKQFYNNLPSDIAFYLVVIILFTLLGWLWYRFGKDLSKRRETIPTPSIDKI
ncbi:hypothetical protein FEM03_13935 [Phragmitibacter flavus]|uniref:Uncharacterized protein n=1 Tax=Phragmitibacter flavus TaxID=2576071 RepID=A0A5R8KDA6_9BACT|nr:hypothetical protein [Phragmitibacter flavus]TLD70281.1 hypothetical protein FEM03_13935 [Phragmitibacter flavus]